MKGMIRYTLAILLLAVIVQAQIQKKIAEFDVPGPTGKQFDYLTVDPGL